MSTTELPPEDRAPVRPPRRVPRGLIAAALLATVVLAVATVMAFRQSDDTDDVSVLNGDDVVASPLTSEELEASVADLEGTDLPTLEYTTFDGDTMALAVDGRPLVVNFWASRCVPCVDEMPAIDEVHRSVGDQVQILGLQVSENATAGARLVERLGTTYPVGRDPTGQVARALGGSYLPSTAFIAANGTIRDVHVGSLEADELRALIDEHLA